jgi:hypothetical protein
MPRKDDGERSFFRCEWCGGPGDLSKASVRKRHWNGLPLICLTCSRHIRGIFSTRTNRKKREEKIDKPRGKIYMLGCLLIETDYGRCKDYLQCKHYLKCLDAAASMLWRGWTTE